ncbi:MAG: YihY/virulence factor BrkB family protein [Chloroflexota bacterium]|nr:YihY/virulence factor BrkB family protein [Chloroflexota bacterium]
MTMWRKRIIRNVRSMSARARKTLGGLWKKLNEDWVFNFSGMLAYSYLTALAPIVLALVAIGSLALSLLAPSVYHGFVHSLAANFPAGLGEPLVNATIAALRKEAGLLLTIAIVAAIYGGSRLFVALDDVFAIIYRTVGRSFLRQNRMAILMLLLFLVMAPPLFIAASLPSQLLSVALPAGALSSAIALNIEGVIAGVVLAFIIFAAIYRVVPNRVVAWRAVWPGALVAAALLNLFEALFPLYRAIFLRNPGYGSAIGLAIVALVFLYYVGLITLLGAEVNSWALGLRPRGANLQQIARRADTPADAPQANPRQGQRRHAEGRTVEPEA